jgi:hypothetical protein
MKSFATTARRVLILLMEKVSKSEGSLRILNKQQCLCGSRKYMVLQLGSRGGGGGKLLIVVNMAVNILTP